MPVSVIVARLEAANGAVCSKAHTGMFVAAQTLAGLLR
jgi:hypothetical protein